MLQYDEVAIKEIHSWKNPEPSFIDNLMAHIRKPINSVTAMLPDAPESIANVLKKSIIGIVSACNDAAHYSTQPGLIYKEFRDNSHKSVYSHKDIQKLDLEHVDRVVGYLAAKYKGIALVEGAATGSAGIFGIPVDIAALITLNLRAISEYATYYGFDTRSQEERLFALNILSLASAPSDASKIVAMSQLIKIAETAAQKKAWKILEQHYFVQISQKIAESLGRKLTKAKLAQIAPVTGSFVGAGFNAYYTSKVCDAAYYLYRERFLAKKYGSKIIDECVSPADSFEPETVD